jgi:ribosomal-protein-alanine N-acetyltransferase
MKPGADSLHIRPMTAGDLSSVMRIDESLSGAPHWPQAAYVAALNPESIPKRVAMVASEPGGGAVIGFAVASLIPPQSELETIAVAAQSRRRGLASRLFEDLVEELRAAGANEILLEVRCSNEAALGFYRSLGFKQSGRRSGYYADPIEDAIQMSLSLD